MFVSHPPVGETMSSGLGVSKIESIQGPTMDKEVLLDEFLCRYA